MLALKGNQGRPQEDVKPLRRMALNVARIETGKSSMRGKLKRAEWNDDLLLLDMIRAVASQRNDVKPIRNAIALTIPDCDSPRRLWYD